MNQFKIFCTGAETNCTKGKLNHNICVCASHSSCRLHLPAIVWETSPCRRRMPWEGTAGPWCKHRLNVISFISTVHCTFKGFNWISTLGVIRSDFFGEDIYFKFVKQSHRSLKYNRNNLHTKLSPTRCLKIRDHRSRRPFLSNVVQEGLQKLAKIIIASFKQ